MNTAPNHTITASCKRLIKLPAQAGHLDQTGDSPEPEASFFLHFNALVCDNVLMKFVFQLNSY